MKKSLLFFLMLISLVIVTQAEPDYHLKQDLNIDFKLGNTIEVISTSSVYDIQNLKVYLSFVPRDDSNQDIVTLKTIPDARKYEDGYVFEWNAVNNKKLAYRLESEIITKNSLKKITESPSFPLKDSPEVGFLDETESVDYNTGNIKSLANSLASGKDSLYPTVHGFADWVNENIEYKMSSTTTHASQKASWVLENREGVCDEITNLFIALCRSVGIPARFVSGVSYTTDSRFLDKWSSHGWAEVYFPGYGWIPFDVTYGEFGYLDPTHIKLKVADDANKSSTKYEWEAKSAKINTGKLDMDIRVKEVGKSVNPLLGIDARVGKSKIGFGSYNFLELKVNNPNHYYVPTQISLSKTNEIKMYDPYNRNILMKPESEKTLFYVFKISEELSKDYVYTFTIDSKTSWNATDRISFTGGKDLPVYSLEEIREIISAQKKEEKNIYSKNITLNCSSDKNTYLVTEVANINCKIKNSGNIMVENLKVCLENDCVKEDLGISEEKSLRFNYFIESQGKRKLFVTAEHKNISKRGEVIFDSFTRPNISIKNLRYPKKVTLNESFNISFELRSENDISLNDIQVQVYGAGINQKWVMDNISGGKKRFVVQVGKNVLAGTKNNINVYLVYKDIKNRGFFANENFEIKVNRPRLSQKILMWANTVQWDIENNIINIIIIVIGSFIVTILVLFWILRNPYNEKFD
ncbi:MAG: transglutaminase-like domain-containing protein [Nanobdellota archaeon]